MLAIYHIQVSVCMYVCIYVCMYVRADRRAVNWLIQFARRSADVFDVGTLSGIAPHGELIKVMRRRRYSRTEYCSIIL